MPTEPAKKPNLLEIDEDYAGQRIDNFLFTRLKGVPKSHIYRLLRKGLVRVNKKRIKPDYRLQAADVLRLPSLTLADTKAPTSPSLKQIKFIEKCILFEDENLMAINKPSGVAVHGGSGVNFGVIEMLRAARPTLRALELVHRLDRDTSGCLLVAKKRSVLKELHELLRNHVVEKIYLTLVQGCWRGGERVVDVALQKNLLQSGERLVRVSDDGKESKTIFKPERIFQQASLLKVKLETGRTHQIRVHAAHIGHPIAGDDKYGDDVFNKEMRHLGLKRLFLHAHELRFKLKQYAEELVINAPLDPALQQFLQVLS